MRQRGDRLVEGQVDVPGHQVPHDLGGAGAIRHELESCAGDVLEVDAADVLPRAGPGSALRRLLRVGLEPGDQLFQVPCRQVLACHDDVRVARQARDRLEILQHVVGQRVDRAVDHVRGPVADADGVAVGSGAHGAADPDGAGRAGDVLDDDRLAERLAHRLGERACQRIDRTARAERHDQGDRMGRIRLRRRGTCECDDGNGQAEGQSAHVTPHDHVGPASNNSGLRDRKPNRKPTRPTA